MAGRFSYSRPERRGATDPWFRIGDLDVGSAAFLALLCAASIVVYGLEPVDKPILTSLAVIPDKVLCGQIWRVVTWPLANGLNQSLLWAAVSVALLWYFGSRLEEQIGRARMTTLLAAIIIVPGIIGTALDLPQAGIRSVEIAVLLIFIAEYPQIRFFFGIPAWVLGAVFVVTDLLQISGARANRQLLFYLLSLVVAALAARAVGMFTAYPWILKTPLPAVLTGDVRKSTPARRSRDSSTVVDGPWAAPPPPRPSPDATAAQAELDVVLDKISATGLDSLSADEKRRLNELSKRLR
jgi:membrane associated rhomboid family serine protease